MTIIFDANTKIIKDVNGNLTFIDAANPAGKTVTNIGSGSGSAPVSVTTKQTFSYTGTTGSFVVPQGVTSLSVKMWGAGGGNGAWPSNSTAGAGGYAAGTVSVTPGETLLYIIGGGGQGTTGSGGDGGLGGWGGGGYGTKGDASGGGGGGYTGLFSGAIHQQTAIMIAGGGGGATGYASPGGGGGGLSGGNGYGTGGGQSTPGGPGTGGALYGGNGVGGLRTTVSSNDDGGGGGGYWGGGGGTGDGRSGGGGSGFLLSASRVSGGTLTAGSNGNNSNTRANPPNTSDSDYVAAPTNTGKGGNISGGNGTDGGHGYMVISYTVGANQAYWLEGQENTAYITSSIAVGVSTSAASAAGQEAFMFVSGTIGQTGANAKKAIFGGDVHLSGALNVGGLSLYTGSCTITTASLTHIFGANNLNLSQTGSVDWFSPNGSYFQNYRGLGAGNSKASCGVIHNSFDWVNPGVGTGFAQASTFTISSTAGDDVGTAMSSVTTDVGVFSAGGTNYGYRFRAPSGPATRTLRIYNSVWSGGVLVTVRAGDSSFPTRTYFLSSGAAAGVSYVWNIVYSTTTTSEIYVTCLLTNNLGSTPNIKLMGATVTSGVQ